MKYIRYLCLVFVCIGSMSVPVWAIKKKKDRGPGYANEQALVEGVLQCMRTKDAYCYDQLFPEMELLSRMIFHNAQNNSKAYNLVIKYNQQAHTDINEFDTLVGAALRADFDSTIARGEKKLNIHWQAIILQRFELVKKRRTRDTVLEKIIPERFIGDVFFADALTGISYAFRIHDMNKIDGRWYGGQVSDVYPVDNKDDLQDAIAYEQWKAKRLAMGDSSMLVKEKELAVNVEEEIEEENDMEEGNEKPIEMREVQERKFYKGTFDNQIPVFIYLRGLKGDCGEPICSYDGMIKFGDQDGFYMLKVKRDEEGSWQMDEIDGMGVMDLNLRQGVLTGTWTANADKTVYDIKLTENALSNKRIKILEKSMREY